MTNPQALSPIIDARRAPDLERRAFAFDRLEIEQRRSGGAPRLVGHAAVFDQLSDDLGGFRERVAPGAFAKSISTDDVRALFNHDPNIVLGRKGAGTLELSEDHRGLAIGVDMPDTAIVRELVVAPIARGDIDQMSFGFRTIADEWSENRDSGLIRTLKEVQLFDVSPVTFAAYPQTDVAAQTFRALIAPGARAADNINSARDFEALLREVGFSRSAARKITACGWSGIRRPADLRLRAALARERAALL